jgi:hypothetical protein
MGVQSKISARVILPLPRTMGISLVSSHMNWAATGPHSELSACRNSFSRAAFVLFASWKRMMVQQIVSWAVVNRVNWTFSEIEKRGRHGR